MPSLVDMIAPPKILTRTEETERPGERGLQLFDIFFVIHSFLSQNMSKVSSNLHIQQQGYVLFAWSALFVVPLQHYELTKVQKKFQYNTSLAVKGALAHRLQNQKWPPGGSKMADRVLKGVYPQVLGRSKQLLQNKFFDPSTPSIRKGRNGEKTEKRGKKIRKD